MFWIPNKFAYQKAIIPCELMRKNIKPVAGKSDQLHNFIILFCGSNLSLNALITKSSNTGTYMNKIRLYLISN